MSEPRHTRLYHFTHCNVMECKKALEGAPADPKMYLDDLPPNTGSSSYVGPKREIDMARLFGYTCAWVLCAAGTVFIIDALIWFTKVCI